MKLKVKVKVGLIVITNYPHDQKSALLRVRGKHQKPYPGSCHPTILALCDENEDQYRALQNKAFEILNVFDLPRNQIKSLNHSTQGDKLYVNYGAFLFQDQLDDIKLPHGSSLRHVSLADARHLKDLTKEFDEKVGVTDPKVTAMFPDEIRAVRKALREFDIPGF